MIAVPLLNSLKVPSGRTLDFADIDLLREAHRCGSIVYHDQPFRLKSGIQSNVYVFCRGDLTDEPGLLARIGAKIVREVWANTRAEDHQPNLIGLPTAGTALAIAASMASTWPHPGDIAFTDPGRPTIACRVMREKLKKAHGANDRWVNGEIGGLPPNRERFTFWTVDNVATDGETKFEAAAQLEQDGYPSKAMPQLIFVDRQQGAVKRMAAAGFERVVVCYNLLDITYLYGELGLWPKDAVKRVEAEIRMHQFS